MDTQEPLDCACLIHGQVYDWMYVEKLYHGLQTHLNGLVRLHVFTEANRSVPQPFIKHSLQDWPDVRGAKAAWWYKLQMFRPDVGVGRMFYLDLDVIITGSLDWVWRTDPRWFWAIKDFKFLWRRGWTGINSSAMIWTAAQARRIWQDFSAQDLSTLRRRYHGDQDYLSTLLPEDALRYLDPGRILSWRWQIKDGGLDFETRDYRKPGTDVEIDPETSLIVFHGHPKPHEMPDGLIKTRWLSN